MNKNEKFLKKGTTILTAKPFAYILCSELRTKKCDYCFKSGKLFKCSCCQCVYYCNRTCQQNAWSIHKNECLNLKRTSPKIVPDVARLMARIIIKLSQGGDEEVGYYTETDYRKFEDLTSHCDNIKKDEKRMEHFLCVRLVLSDFLDIPLPDIPDLLGIYGKICTNSFNISDMDMTNIGVGIYLGPSIMDHSCNPNTVYTFDGTTMIIKTIKDLPCLDWSLIRISYIDPLNTKENRRSMLQSSYYFLCDCEKCEEPEPITEAAACPNKFCTYPCSPEAVVCEKCNTKFPEDFKEIFDEVSDFTAHHLQKMDSIAYLDVSRLCLKKQEGVLHPYNVNHVQTLFNAYYSCMCLEYWEEAGLYVEKLIEASLIYYGKVHPMIGMRYLILGKIYVYLKKPKQALEVLNKAGDILTITHGAEHTLIQQCFKPLLLQATVMCEVARSEHETGELRLIKH